VVVTYFMANLLEKMEECGRKVSWLILKHWPDIDLEGMR
jgi:hypothetical protein